MTPQEIAAVQSVVSAMERIETLMVANLLVAMNHDVYAVTETIRKADEILTQSK